MAMKVAESKNGKVEIFQVSSSNFELFVNGSFVEIFDRWDCQSNLDAAKNQMQREVSNAENVEFFLSDEWQNS